MKKQLRVTIPVSVNVGDVIIGLSRTEAHNLIIGIDAQMVDVDFTESVIKSLVKSIRGDLTGCEFDSLIRELKTIGRES